VAERAHSARRTTAIPDSQLETAEIVAADIEERRPSEAAAVLADNARIHSRSRVKPGSLLAAKAATEYVYVAKDMRRILIVAALLAAVMLVLWFLLVLEKVIPLPFY
jgi:hypothetical protein